MRRHQVQCLPTHHEQCLHGPCSGRSDGAPVQLFAVRKREGFQKQVVHLRAQSVPSQAPRLRGLDGKEHHRKGGHGE